MSEVVPFRSKNSIIPTCSPESMEDIRILGMEMRTMQQLPFVTQHLIHGGVYYRSIWLPEETRLVTVMVKIPTGLVTVGDTTVFANGRRFEYMGYNVLACEANRRQAYITNSPCAFTMSFRYSGKSVEEAQRTFTDEYDLLPPLSDASRHIITITGE